jgi:hypothetical protein
VAQGNLVHAAVTSKSGGGIDGGLKFFWSVVLNRKKSDSHQLYNFCSLVLIWLVVHES